MIVALTWFIRAWCAIVVAVNLASIFFAPSDLSSNVGLGDPFGPIELLLSPRAMLLHLGYLFGNLLLMLPAAGAAAWRQQLILHVR